MPYILFIVNTKCDKKPTLMTGLAWLSNLVMINPF